MGVYNTLFSFYIESVCRNSKYWRVWARVRVKYKG